MSDLISRQAAIDALAEEWYHNTEDYRTAVRVIGSLPSAQPEQRWVPCSERLPEEAYDEYLVSWTADELGENCCIEILVYEEEFEFDHQKDRFVGKWLLEEYMKVYTNVRVIAWQPLPDPYKESEENEDNARTED